jgi:hypothetical protein
MKKLFIIFTVLSAVFIANPLFSSQFYLSTEKSFMENEDARVKIESVNISSVTVRLYKIPDPKSFIRSRRNINRVYIESEYIQANPASMLTEYANTFKQSMRIFGRKTFDNQEFKSGAFYTMGDTLETRRPQSKVSIGRIEEFEFINEFEMQLAGGHSWTYSFIDFGKLKGGLYLAEVFTPSYIGYTLVHVSKNAVYIKKSESRMLIRSVDKASGTPVRANISVYDFDKGNEISKGRADNDGIFDYKFRPNQHSELLVYAETDDDFTFYKVSFYPSAEKERIVYLYTDSPIYKPGQTVNIKGVVRDFVNSEYNIPRLRTADMKITDPRGGTISLSASRVGGYGSFLSSYDIPENAPTGIYRVFAAIDGKDYSGEFRVEHYVKPQFKVDVVTPKRVIVGSEKVNFTIRAEYFTGMKVADARVTYSIFRTPARDDLMESERNIFEDPAYASRVEFLESISATLDRSGEFKGSFLPSKYGIDRDYVYIIRAQAVDDSYARANGQTTVKVVKTEFMLQARVGKSVYTERENVTVNFRLMYHDGKPVVNKDVEYSATIESDNNTIASGRSRTGSDGYGNISFRARGTGFLRINLNVTDSLGNKLEENVYTWLGKDGATFVYTSGDITIVLDKDEYKVGERANVLVVSPVSFANALITTEREDIFTHSSRRLNGNSMMFEVPVTSQFTPNFFLSVSFIFNNQVYENTVRVKAPPLDKMLNVKIEPDKESYYPREKGTIKLQVTDANGRPVDAEISVAVVNEALYRISSELFPDPRVFFYSYRWNSISSHNSIALRFYGYSRMVRQRLAMNYYDRKVWGFEDFLNAEQSRYAGVKEAESRQEGAVPRAKANGEDEDDEEEAIIREIFKDQILWEGSVTTDRRGNASVTVDFPDNLTEWRIVAVAFTKDTRVGKETSTVKTAKDFFVRFNTPRNLTYADRASGFITLVNNTSSRRSISLDIDARNMKTDFRSRNININAGSQTVIEFSLEPDKVGRAFLTATAKGGGQTDIMRVGMDVLPVSIKQVHSEVKLISRNTDSFTFSVPSGAIPETVSATVNLSEMENPFGVIAGALPFLKSYPYGCVEQTVSSFLPNLVAFDVAQNLSIELPHAFADKDDILKSGLSKLVGYQSPQGGWGWWSEGGVDIYMTAYVLYAMVLARRSHPQFVDNNSFNRGVNALRSALTRSGNIDPNTMIYGYYVLSEAGYYYRDMLNRQANSNIQSPYHLALLILTAKNSGLTDLARSLADRLEQTANPATTGVSWSSSGHHYWYGDSVVITSYAVRALIAAKPDSDYIGRGVIYLISSRNNGTHWRSTRDTALAVYALSDYAKGGFVRTSASSVNVALNNRVIGKFEFSPRNFRSSISLDSSSVTPGNTYTVTFPNVRGNFVGDVLLEYNNEDTQISANNNGINISRSYYRIADKTRLVPLGRNTTVNAGDVILVEVNVSGSPSLDYVVIEDPIPSGFLPVYDVNEYNISGVSFFKDITHHEFGSDKSSFFLRNFRSGKYHYILQANYPGVYYSKPGIAYGMYRPQEWGNSDSTLIEIRK